MKFETYLAVKEAAVDGTLLTKPEEVGGFLEDLKELAQEVFVVITLNTRHRVIQRHIVSVGTVNSTLIHPREVFRPAIQDGAVGVILAHNHPSSDVTPSAEDIKITRRLIKAGSIVGIQVLDHVIVGDRCLSLRENGLCEFNQTDEVENAICKD